MDDFIIIITGILLYMLGASLGSFGMVVIRRGSNYKSWITGRSYCESCHKELKWWEMIPSISYILLGGKCSKCKSRIDPSHFYGETSLGILTLVTSMVYLFESISDKEALVYGIVLFVMWLGSMQDILYKHVNPIPTYLGIIAIAIINKSVIMIGILLALDIVLTYKDKFKYIGGADVDFLILIYAALGVNNVSIMKKIELLNELNEPLIYNLNYLMNGMINQMLNVIIITCASALVYYMVKLRKEEDKRIPLVPFLSLGYVVTILGISLV